MKAVGQTKLGKLRAKLAENKKKRDLLNESIKKIQQQITEEETKEFRSVIEEMELTIEEAVQLLREGKKPSVNKFTGSPVEQPDSNQEGKEHNYGNI